jgi:hypothetical protein
MLDELPLAVNDTHARLGDNVFAFTPAPRRRFAWIRYQWRDLRLWLRGFFHG